MGTSAGEEVGGSEGTVHRALPKHLSLLRVVWAVGCLPGVGGPPGSQDDGVSL